MHRDLDTDRRFGFVKIDVSFQINPITFRQRFLSISEQYISWNLNFLFVTFSFRKELYQRMRLHPRESLSNKKSNTMLHVFHNHSISIDKVTPWKRRVYIRRGGVKYAEETRHSRPV